MAPEDDLREKTWVAVVGTVRAKLNIWLEETEQSRLALDPFTSSADG